MDTQTSRFLTILLSLGAVLAIAACTPTPQARFSYHYKRPEALGPMPKEVSMAMPSIAPEKALEHGEQKALRLAEALGIKLDPRDTTRRVDAYNEILTLRDRRYRLKIYVPSGMVKFRDTKLYNQEPEDQKTLTALDNEAALKVVRQALDKLSQHELIQSDQLLIDAARFSNRKAQGNPGRKPDQIGRPKPGPVEIVDTRVFVPRAIDGMGVSGHGVRIMLDKRGEIAGLDLLWRELKLEDRKLPAKLTMADAIKRFETELKVPSNTQVDVIVVAPQLTVVSHERG